MTAENFIWLYFINKSGISIVYIFYGLGSLDEYRSDGGFRSVTVCLVEHKIVMSFSYYTHTHIYIYIQGVPGGMCQTSGECSLC